MLLHQTALSMIISNRQFPIVSINRRMNRLTNVFSKRWVVIPALLFFLIYLMWYGFQNAPSITLRMCLENPALYDGCNIGIGNEATIAQLIPGGFLIKQMGKTMRVYGDSQNASAGDFVQLRAIFHEEGYLELVHFHVAKKRRVKIFVSLVPTLLILIIFFKRFKFDWRQILFYERN